MEAPAASLVMKDSPWTNALVAVCFLGLGIPLFWYYVSQETGRFTWGFLLLLAIPALFIGAGLVRIGLVFRPRTRLTVTPEGIWTKDSGCVAWADLASYYALFASSKYGLTTYLLLYTTAGQEIAVAFDSADATWETTRPFIERLNTNPALRFDGVQRAKLKRAA